MKAAARRGVVTAGLVLVGGLGLAPAALAYDDPGVNTGGSGGGAGLTKAQVEHNEGTLQLRRDGGSTSNQPAREPSGSGGTGALDWELLASVAGSAVIVGAGVVTMQRYRHHHPPGAAAH